MKTQDVKNYLSMLMTQRGEWKRRRKYKQDGNVMRDFENTLKYHGCTFTVSTGPEDGRVHSILITMPEPPEVEKPKQERKPLKVEGDDSATAAYFYKLYTGQECEEWVDIEYPVTHVLMIGSQPSRVDDGPYGAQKALEPMMQQAIGDGPRQRELMEGTFELMDGDAAKLEPLLKAAGWQQGGW
jgi:hypothetical protein